MIQNISPQYYFHVANGIIVKTLKELPAVLERIDNNVFSHHVNPSKNDFATWINDVFRLNNLSAKLYEANNKEESIRILKAYLMQNKLSNIPRLNAQENQKQSMEPTEENDEPKQKVVQEPVQKEPKKFLWTSKILEKQFEKTEKAVIKTEKKTADPDEYFEKNPVLFEHAIQSKKKAFTTKPLEIMTFTGSESPEQLIELFKDNYSKVYQRLSLLRKTGFDTSLAELMLYRIPAKIQVYEATRAVQDAAIIKRYLNEIIEELNNIK